MDLVEQVCIFGLTTIYTFAPDIRLLSLIFNYAKRDCFPTYDRWQLAELQIGLDTKTFGLINLVSDEG